MLKDSFIMSWKNIIANKMRSFLTVLGIMIGIASIIALITIVSGVTDSILSQVEGMGANTITVSVTGNGLKAGLNSAEVDEISALEEVVAVSPTVQLAADVYFNGAIEEQVMVIGRGAYTFVNDSDLATQGRPLLPIDYDENSQVCLLSTSLADTLLGTAPLNESELTINGHSFTVVGLLDSDTVGGNAVYIPYTTAMRLFGIAEIQQLEVFVTDGNRAGQISGQIEAKISAAYNGNEANFTVKNMQGILDTISSITAMMGMMLGGIASIALLVGGIGIMNMMLVSVTERTAEIGLRKALGAPPKRIRQQFLIESIFLCLFGGLLGLLLGIGLALMICMAIGSPFTLSLSAIYIAIGFSVLVGVVFGYSPAKRASKMNPIEALRL